MINVEYRALERCQKPCKEMVLMDLLLLGLLALGKVVWGAVMSLGENLLGELVIEGSGS